MPAILLRPPSADRESRAKTTLPQILRTPSGLAILELQGTVNASGAAQSSSLAAPIGKLVFPQYDASNTADDTSWHKRVYLYVGKHQRLTGEVKKLAKPIAVIQRRETSSTARSDEPEELEIAEIVHYKLLFAHRPEPVGSLGSD